MAPDDPHTNVNAASPKASRSEREFRSKCFRVTEKPYQLRSSQITLSLIGKVMIEALWSVEFTSDFGGGGYGCGIAVFETGRIFGGDSAMIYIGSYRIDGGRVHADIRVQRYASVAGMASVVGFDDFHLRLTGDLGHQQMLLSGHVLEDPSRTVQVLAHRRAELP